MSQEITAPPAASYSWSETWIKALTQPSVETYEVIVNDPKASPNRAYIWVAVTSLIGYALSVLLQTMLGSTMSFLSQPGREGAAGALGTAGAGIGTLICCAPVVAAGAVLGLVIAAGLSNLIAAMLGGTGTFSKLVYAVGAYEAPLTIVSAVVGAIPIVNLLTFPLGIYALVLNVIAVKAVHRFSWGKAIASSVLILAAILVLVAIVTIVILALLGPAIGNIYSNIIENI